MTSQRRAPELQHAVTCKHRQTDTVRKATAQKLHFAEIGADQLRAKRELWQLPTPGAGALTRVVVSPPNLHELTCFAAHPSKQGGRHWALYARGSFYVPSLPTAFSQLLTLLRIIHWEEKNHHDQKSTPKLEHCPCTCHPPHMLSI